MNSISNQLSMVWAYTHHSGTPYKPSHKQSQHDGCSHEYQRCSAPVDGDRDPFLCSSLDSNWVIQH